MSLLFLFLSFLMLSFSLFYSPVSMVVILMSMSLSMVGVLSFFSSFWYSYILFLIYVGGLLVMFIYICLVSSNVPLRVSVESLMLVGTASLACSFMEWESLPTSVLGPSSSGSGMSLVTGSNISIFLFLVVLLLAMLLVVVRVSGVGTAIIVDEKS
uniref:NADH dehydrogenase subunit 6 n=1 Tax=Melibe leonina TaxID=76178 RepID=A0A0F6QIH8_MELLB|nr:NADH dehydrogenase subunit 6 [Melibe leonina]AKE07271.1 NADH dehydrogenase subunit 6 [Melibe leonina]